MNLKIYMIATGDTAPENILPYRICDGRPFGDHICSNSIGISVVLLHFIILMLEFLFPSFFFLFFFTNKT